MTRYDSDLGILRYYKYDLYANRDYIDEKTLDEIVYHCTDDEIHELYKNHSYPFDNDFYKKIDNAYKKQIKDGVNEYIHALYLIFFSLLRIKYGKQTCVDIRVSKWLLYILVWNCCSDYDQFIPLNYTRKLFEIAKHDVSKHFKIPIDVLPKEIPDDWTIDRFDRWDWVTEYIESCLDDEEKITYFHLCGYYSFYYDKHWLDKKLPEIKFDF